PPPSPTLEVSDDNPITDSNLSETEIIPLTPITTQAEVQQSEIPIQNDDPTLTPVLKNATSPYNPILEESLEMLEQVLQQVLDPVIREFEQPDPTDSEDSVTPESELPPETEPNWEGLIFTLDEESLMVQEGQLLTLSGQIDILNVDRLDSTERITPREYLFQGILRYELRHPQTAQVLLDVQKPLSAEELPLIFSHTLEIPENCQSCLLLGKVTLYGSGSRALASQPFTVTADLDQLLGAIALESEASVEENKDLNPTAKPDSQAPLSTVSQLDWTLLNLIDKPKNTQSIVFSSSSGQSLPPQLYQPDSSEQGSKSLDLPTFPKTLDVESETDSVEVNLENSEEERSPDLTLTIENSNPEKNAPEQVNEFSIASSHETSLTEKSATEALVIDTQNQTEANQETLSLQDSATIPVANDTTELPDAWIVTPDDQLDTSLIGELPETPQPKYSLTNVPISESNVKETAELDRAFHALNSDDRFWGRIHSLVEDTELSEWLKFELPLYENPDEEEATSEADFLVSEEEEIAPSLNGDNDLADFDESIWDEETEQFGSVIADTAEVQPPTQNETNSVQSIPNPDWTAQEFVVDDDDESLQEPEPVGVRAKNSRLVHSAKRNGSQLENKSFSRSESGIPLPTPELFIPTNELAAGEPILVRVKLASHPDRLGVKLWVKDRQSRSLLDGPRWLMDLIPNGSGELEALTQLVVPFGTVEIRFEAIAIDLDSERESHKVMVDSIVIPPDLPSLSFEEFES
ncbi:MAG TPA: hypothetical protein DEG47_10995, partial [Cyanobacteria bacterium UBA11148]|nr:hypothetical protein [Cyanobacteria bacterium UBA11148]